MFAQLWLMSVELAPCSGALGSLNLARTWPTLARCRPNLGGLRPVEVGQVLCGADYTGPSTGMLRPSLFRSRHRLARFRHMSDGNRPASGKFGPESTGSGTMLATFRPPRAAEGHLLRNASERRSRLSAHPRAEAHRDPAARRVLGLVISSAWHAACVLQCVANQMRRSRFCP